MKNAKFTVSFATTQEELNAVYKLRYDDMILEYSDDNVNDSGLDCNEYDSYARHIIVKDNATGEIVGYYRMITSSDLVDGKTFVCEEEYNLDYLKQTGEKICEFSRAVVKKEYRGGIILLLIWKFILQYVLDNGYRYMVGDASFYGTDRDKYVEEISYLVHNYSADPSLQIKSRDVLPPMELLPEDQCGGKEIMGKLPPLIKAYINLGAKIASETFTDTAFGSVDVFILVDLHNCNLPYVQKLLAF